MPVEIREIVIKTTIQSNDRVMKSALGEEEIKQLKNTIIEECKRMMDRQQNKLKYKR